MTVKKPKELIHTDNLFYDINNGKIYKGIKYNSSLNPEDVRKMNLVSYIEALQQEYKKLKIKYPRYSKSIDKKILTLEDMKQSRSLIIEPASGDGE